MLFGGQIRVDSRNHVLDGHYGRYGVRLSVTSVDVAASLLL